MWEKNTNSPCWTTWGKGACCSVMCCSALSWEVATLRNQCLRGMGIPHAKWNHHAHSQLSQPQITAINLFLLLFFNTRTRSKDIQLQSITILKIGSMSGTGTWYFAGEIWSNIAIVTNARDASKHENKKRVITKTVYRYQICKINYKAWSTICSFTVQIPAWCPSCTPCGRLNDGQLWLMRDEPTVNPSRHKPCLDIICIARIHLWCGFEVTVGAWFAKINYMRYRMRFQPVQYVAP